MRCSVCGHVQPGDGGLYDTVLPPWPPTPLVLVGPASSVRFYGNRPHDEEIVPPRDTGIASDAK